MDFDQQLKTEHLLLEDRVCRVCKIKKGLLADFYRCRRDPSLTSSYSYECKQCTLERVRKKYEVGTCIICDKEKQKLEKNICRKCRNLLLEKAIPNICDQNLFAVIIE